MRSSLAGPGFVAVRAQASAQQLCEDNTRGEHRHAALNHSAGLSAAAARPAPPNPFLRVPLSAARTL